MKKLRIIILLFSVIFFIGCASSTGNTKKLDNVRFQTLSKYTQAIGTIEKYHYDNIKLKEIVEKSLDGLMKELGNGAFYKKGSYYSKSDNSTFLHSFLDNKKKLNNNSIKSSIIGNNILYIKIPILYEGLSIDLKNQINLVKNRKGIVLDLRDNPGGMFKEVINIVDLFIKTGEITTSKFRTQREEKFYSKSDYLDLNTPLIILVNNLTGSGSELISGTLQYHKRAVLLGEKTFGFGSINQEFPISLDKKEIIYFKIGENLLPNNISFHEKGITPDISITNKNKKYDNQLNETIKYFDKLFYK